MRLNRYRPRPGLVGRDSAKEPETTVPKRIKKLISHMKPKRGGHVLFPPLLLSLSCRLVSMYYMYVVSRWRPAPGRARSRDRGDHAWEGDLTSAVAATGGRLGYR